MTFIFSGSFEFTFGEPACYICGKQITEPGGLSYCPEHLLQYERRQRLGVPTDELSEQWEDSLDIWRDRPPELDVELGVRGTSTLFLFQERDGDWLRFDRLYQGSRSSDTLAINLRTGDIRRFVEASVLDIEDVLHRGRPAPYQEELLPYWGQQYSLGRHANLTQPSMGAGRPLGLPVPMPFPVYGLVGNPLDLAVCSLSRSHSGHRLTSVGLTFSSPRYPRRRESFELASSDAHNRSVVYHPRERSAPAFWEGESRIDGQLFQGEIERWSLPQEFAQHLLPGFSRDVWEMHYRLTGEETILGGNVQGPSVEEVLELLQGAVIINDRPDLLEHYQRELDQERKRLFGE